MSDCWFALYVKSRFEHYVTKQLSTKGYETFLPTYLTKRKWSDRVKSVSRPLFPSYVFCRFDVHTRLPILLTPGVMAVVGSGRLPTPIDESEVAALRLVMNSGVITHPCPYVAIGERVQVQAGPLKGLIGFVVKTKGDDRLVLSITLLMRSMSVEIGREHIKRLDREGVASHRLFNGHDAGTESFEPMSMLRDGTR
jgi:transcriptional antiterminator NusG